MVGTAIPFVTSSTKAGTSVGGGWVVSAKPTTTTTKPSTTTYTPTKVTIAPSVSPSTKVVKTTTSKGTTYTVPSTGQVYGYDPTKPTETTSATGGVFVVSNVGTPVYDIKSGKYLTAGEGVINVAGGEKGGGVSYEITAPPSLGFQALTAGVQAGQAVEKEMLAPSIQTISPQQMASFQALSESTNKFIAGVGEQTKAQMDIFGQAFIPSLKSADIWTQAGLLTLQQEQAKQVPLSWSLGGAKSAGTQLLLGTGAGLIETGRVILHPIETGKSLWEAVTHPAETGTALGTVLWAQAKEKPFFFAGEIIGGLLGAKGLGAGLKTTKLVTQVSAKELKSFITKVSVKKIVPEIGEGLKIGKEVEYIGDVAQFTKKMDIPNLKDVTAGLGVSEKLIGVKVIGKETGKKYELIFTPSREISPVVQVGEKFAGTLKGQYKPSLLVSLEEPKVSYPLADQKITTARAIFKGQVGEGDVTAQIKGISARGGYKTGVFGPMKVMEIPAPEEFAKLDLKKYISTSELLKISAPTYKGFLKFPITSQEILSAQVKRYVSGVGISQEYGAVTWGEKELSRSIEMGKVTFPKIGTKILKPTKLPPSPKVSKIMGEGEAGEGLQLMKPVKQITAQQEKLIREAVEKEVISPAIVRNIEKTVVSTRRFPITISVKQFKQVGITTTGLGTAPAFGASVFGKLGEAYAPKATAYTIPTVEYITPTKPITEITGISGGIRGISGISYPTVSIKPTTAFITPTTPSITTKIGTGLSELFKPTTGVGIRTGYVTAIGLASIQALAQTQAQTQMTRQITKQMQVTSQLTKQITSGRFGLGVPTFKVPPTTIPRIPPITFGLGLGYRVGRIGIKGKKRRRLKLTKRGAIPFSDWLSVTQTTARTLEPATMPRISFKAGSRYLREVQKGRLRFPTVEQMTRRRR